MKVIDLFAGCGGLSLGFAQKKYKIIKAVEFDPQIARTFKINHKKTKVIVEDIKKMNITSVFKQGEADIVIGGPPCQGFSMAGARIRRTFLSDPRNYLFRHYFNVVKRVKPKFFIMENVKGLLSMEGGKIFKEIIKTLSDVKKVGLKYNVFYKIVKAKEFGIPQKRERLIIIGSIYNAKTKKVWELAKQEVLKKYPSFFNCVKLRGAIGGMPLPTTSGLIKNPKPKSAYQMYLHSKNKTITNHNLFAHSPVVIKRIEKIRCGENYTKLKEPIKSIHSGSYGRLSWSELAPTITTRFDTPAGGRFIHPTADRTLTPREAARIQSFPDDFVFVGNKTSICKQIGNAVPPKISYFLATLINVIYKEKKNG